jgi:hypothetical protein
METAVDIANLAAKIDSHRVTDLVRRASIPSGTDGYPSNSMPEHSSGGSHADPTFMAATARPARRDEQQQSLKYMEKDLSKAEKFLRGALGVLDNQQRKDADKRARPATVPCLVCELLPAEKSGYCMNDYNDWWKYGKPDRLLWEMFKREEMDSDGNLRVPECPPPTGEAIRGPWRTP